MSEDPFEAEALASAALQHYERREFAAAEQTLDRLIACAPGRADLACYRLLAKLKSVHGGAEGARAVMKRGLDAHTGQTDFVAAYADTLPPAEGIAALERHLAEIRDPGRAAYILLRLTTIRAPLVRQAAGLPPRYGLSWRDTYQWPDAACLPVLRETLQAELAAGSRRATARLDLAYIAAAHGDWESAEVHLGGLRRGPKRTPADFTAFGNDFHAGLEAMTDAELTEGLAPVERLLGSAGSGPTLFMASDETYFTAFTLPFLRQLETAQVHAPVHVHLLDGDERSWADPREALRALAFVQPTFTAEKSGAAANGRAYARNYYHAVRYVRLYQELMYREQSMWMLDCDVQLLRDPRPLLSSIGGYDLALRTNPCSFEPMLKITASCVGISPTPGGLEFARRVAATIVHWKNAGTWNWGVDQIALFSAYAHMSAQGREPRCLFLDDAAMNDKTGDTGVIRFLSGLDKFIAR